MITRKFYRNTSCSHNLSSFISSISFLSTRSSPGNIFTKDQLEIFSKQVFMKVGLSELDANIVSKSLVKSNLRGQDGHGVSRIPIYSKRIRSGIVNPTPNISIENITPIVSKCNGDNGMGVIVTRKAMDHIISKASTFGIGMIGIRNSTHFGASSEYVQQALDYDMMSMVFTNSSPALPPHGGSKAFLGANPIAAGAPSRIQPFLMDMSSTIIARGKLRLAAQRGEAIPEGIGLDKHGNPTIDGMEAFHGVTLPFGGVKGAAISMMMEIFAGLYTGAAYGGKVSSLYNDFTQKQNVGHLLIVMRCDMFMPMEEFLDRMDDFVCLLKSQPKASGFENILMVGEPEAIMERNRLRDGIPIQQDVVLALNREASLLDIPPLVKA